MDWSDTETIKEMRLTQSRVVYLKKKENQENAKLNPKQALPKTGSASSRQAQSTGGRCVNRAVINRWRRMKGQMEGE